MTTSQRQPLCQQRHVPPGRAFCCRCLRRRPGRSPAVLERRAGKQAILDFVAATTTPGSPDFVPPEARLATFDQDGATWVEQPMYTPVLFCLARLQELVKEQPGLAASEPFKTLLAGTREAMDKLAGPDFEKLAAATLTGITPALTTAVRASSEAAYAIPPEQVVGAISAVQYGYAKDGRPMLTEKVSSTPGRDRMQQSALLLAEEGAVEAWARPFGMTPGWARADAPPSRRTDGEGSLARPTKVIPDSRGA